MNPPMIAPIRNIRFQRWLLQLKLKRLTRLPAPTIAHIVRRLAEKPNDLPKYIKRSIIIVIESPEIYQGHGWLIKFNIAELLIFLQKNYFC